MLRGQWGYKIRQELAIQTPGYPLNEYRALIVGRPPWHSPSSYYNWRENVCPLALSLENLDHILLLNTPFFDPPPLLWKLGFIRIIMARICSSWHPWTPISLSANCKSFSTVYDMPMSPQNPMAFVICAWPSGWLRFEFPAKMTWCRRPFEVWRKVDVIAFNEVWRDVRLTYCYLHGSWRQCQLPGDQIYGWAWILNKVVQKLRN